MCPERVRLMAVRGGFLRALRCRVKPDFPSVTLAPEKALHQVCSQPKTGGAARHLATGPKSQCRALSTAGPSSGIAEIHLPIRDRPC